MLKVSTLIPTGFFVGGQKKQCGSFSGLFWKLRMVFGKYALEMRNNMIQGVCQTQTHLGIIPHIRNVCFYYLFLVTCYVVNKTSFGVTKTKLSRGNNK